MSAATYGRSQRLLECTAIAFFALLAAWSLAHLGAATGRHFAAVVLAAAPAGWLAAAGYAPLESWPWILAQAMLLFTALGAPHKPAVGYRIPCRIFTDIVTLPAKRVEERDITVFDQIHPPPGKPTGGSPLSPAERRARGETAASGQAAGGVKK